MKTTTKRETVIEVARREVLRALAKGPRTGAELRDDLAARCGSKDNVGRGIGELSRAGLITEAKRCGSHVTWKLADAPAVPATEAAA